MLINKLRTYHLILIFCLCGSWSCSGYRFKKKSNPFSSYGIRSVSIPMFLNRTSLPNVSGPLTKEIVLVLSRFPQLKIEVGDGKTDAVLLGIINSDKNFRGTLSTEGRIFSNNDESIKNSLEGRGSFYIPQKSKIELSLNLILIKNPNKEIIEVAQSELGPLLQPNSKIIFNEMIVLSDSFSRIVFGNANPDQGAVVNFTQNNAKINRSIENMAEVAAQNFKDLILDVF